MQNAGVEINPDVSLSPLVLKRRCVIDFFIGFYEDHGVY